MRVVIFTLGLALLGDASPCGPGLSAAGAFPASAVEFSGSQGVRFEEHVAAGRFLSRLLDVGIGPRSISPPPRTLGDSLDVRLLGRALHGSSFCTAVRGDRLYMGSGSSFLSFDVSNPSDPALLGYLRTRAAIWNLVVEGGTAYLANMDEGLTIVDCSRPEEPATLGSYPLEPGAVAYGIDARNDTAWVAAGSGGVVVLDCRNPADPSLVGVFDPWGPFDVTHIALDVSIRGSLAFVAYADILGGLSSWPVAAGLGVLDVSAPTAIDTIGIYSLGTYGCPRALSVTGDTLACVAGGFKDLYVFDCSVPDSARVVSTFITEPMDTNYASDVWVDDGLVYLGDGYAWTDNLLIFDLSSGDSAMVPVGSLATRNITWGLSVQDSIAYIAEEWGSLTVVDCRDKGNPATIANYDIGGYAQGVFLDGPLAYVACEGGGLRIVDCADPGQAREVSVFDTRGRASSAWVKNDTAYVAEGFDWVQGPSGLEVIDCTALGSPGLLGSYDPGDDIEFEDIHMVGDTAYIANGINGLRIMDCSDPTDLRTIGSFDVNPEDTVKAYDIYVQGRTAYLAYSRHGLWIFDCSDPTSPDPLGSFDTPTPAMGVHVSGNRAYVACGSTLLQQGSLRVLDVGNPDSILELGSWDADGSPTRVVAVGNMVYLASGTGGVRIFDASIPVQPEEVGYYVTADRAADLQVSGGDIYVADMSGGLYILEFTGVGIGHGGETDGGMLPRTAMLQNFPNPFPTSTRIRYAVERADRVEIAVYTVRGRLVRRLVEGRRSPGTYIVEWDGRDLQGREVPSGIYLARFMAGDGPATARKLIVIR